MWDCSKVPEMLFSEFPVFYTNEMIDEVFSGFGGVGIHCSMPIPHLNLKMAVGRKKKKKNMKLLLLFTKVVFVMLMAFRMKNAKHAEVPNENIKTNTI